MEDMTFILAQFSSGRKESLLKQKTINIIRLN